MDIHRVERATRRTTMGGVGELWGLARAEKHGINGPKTTTTNTLALYHTYLPAVPGQPAGRQRREPRSGLPAYGRTEPEWPRPPNRRESGTRSDCKIGLQGTTVVSTRETWMPPTTPRRTAPNVGQPLHHPVCASTVGHRATCCTSKEEEKKRGKSVWSAACCRSDPLRRAWYAPCVARHETE